MNTSLVKLAFSRYQLNKHMSFKDSLEYLWEQGLVNVGQLAERAIVKTGKLRQTARNHPGSDFTDHSDSKYLTVGYYPSGYATLADVGNKIGTLRVCCYEPKTQRNYYFLIPHEVYAPYAGKTMKIGFDREGNPRAPARKGTSRPNLWDYEVSQQQWAGKIKR